MLATTHQDSALYPFIGQLERAARFEREDTPAARLGKLEALVTADAPSEGDVQLIAEMLSVPLDGAYPALELTPQRKKEKTLIQRQFTLGQRHEMARKFAKALGVS